MKEVGMTRVVVVALIAWSAAAQAQSAGAQAEVLYRQGRSLMAEGKIAEACSAFAASQMLEVSRAAVVASGQAVILALVPGSGAPARLAMSVRILVGVGGLSRVGG